MERMLIMCNTCMASARLRRARFIMRDNLGIVVFWNDLLKLYIRNDASSSPEAPVTYRKQRFLGFDLLLCLSQESRPCSVEVAADLGLGCDHLVGLDVEGRGEEGGIRCSGRTRATLVCCPAVARYLSRVKFHVRSTIE